MAKKNGTQKTTAQSVEANKRKEIQETEVLLEELLNMDESEIQSKIAELQKEIVQTREAAEAEKERVANLTPNYHELTDEEKEKRAKIDATKSPEELARIESKRARKVANAQYWINSQKTKVQNELSIKAFNLSKKLTFYKAFLAHRSEILNLRQYQLQLQDRLDKLEEEKQKAEEQEKLVGEIDKEADEIFSKGQELLAKRHELDKRLNAPDLSMEEKRRISEEKADIQRQMTQNEERYTSNRAKSRERTVKADSKQITDEITRTKIVISKTSMVWRSLLTGKNWDDIQAKLSQAKFTGENGTTERIKALSEKARPIKNREDDIIRGGNNEDPFVEDISDEIQRTRQVEPTDSEPTPPTPYRSYKEEHKILGKIPFWGKYKEAKRKEEYRKSFEKYEKDKLDYDTKKQEAEEAEKAEREKDEKDLSKVTNLVLQTSEQGNTSRETAVFQNIATGGIRTALRADKETLLKLQRVSAAHAAEERQEQLAEKKRTQKDRDAKRHQANLDRDSH